MSPTSVRLLVAIGMSGVLVGYLGAGIWDDWTGAPPVVPFAAPLLLAVLAIAFVIAGVTLRPRLERRPGHRPLDPFTAARTAVLALASSRAGAAVTGVYLGYAGFLLVGLDNTFRRRLVLVVGAAALAGLGLTVAAHWLERICRIDSSDGDAESAASGA
jgi:MFS family permease